MKLHVIIEKDEAGYYVAEVPALPGCFSQGKTHEEAIANIKEAIEGWLQVMESKQSFDSTRLVEVRRVMGTNIKLCSGAEAVRKFQRAGWSVARQKGSHVMMTKPGYSGHCPYLNTVSLVLACFVN